MATLEHPGLKLQAVQNADGTWNILDVPILPFVKKGTPAGKPAPEDIGAEWMNKTIRFAQMEEEAGHLGSLHVHHHGNEFPQYAGKILPRRVGTTVVEGKTVPCLFGDFLFVPEEVLGRIERNELSYRSPEVYNWLKPRVDTVALLPTEPPHFRMAMTGIGTKIPNTATGVPEHAAFSALFNQTSPYRFAEDFDMPDDDVKDDADEKKKDTKDEGGGGEVKSAVADIEAMMEEFKPLLDLLPKLQAMIDGGVAEEEAPAELMEGEEEEEENPIGEEVTPVQLKDPEVSAKLRAQGDRLDAIEKRDTVREMVGEEVAKLQSENYEVSDGAHADLVAFAEQGKEPFARFCAAFRRQSAPRSSDTLAQAEARARKNDVPEVAKFQQRGPEALTQAREGVAKFADYQRRGGTGSLEDYLEFSVTAEEVN